LETLTKQYKNDDYYFLYYNTGFGNPEYVPASQEWVAMPVATRLLVKTSVSQPFFVRSTLMYLLFKVFGGTPG